jgi:hypothetical protein
VTSEDFRLEVPLVAIKPCAIFEITRFLNYGNILASKNVSRSIVIKNDGLKVGKFELPNTVS